MAINEDNVTVAPWLRRWLSAGGSWVRLPLWLPHKDLGQVLYLQLPVRFGMRLRYSIRAVVWSASVDLKGHYRNGRMNERMSEWLSCIFRSRLSTNSSLLCRQLRGLSPDPCCTRWTALWVKRAHWLKKTDDDVAEMAWSVCGPCVDTMETAKTSKEVGVKLMLIFPTWRLSF